MSIQIVMLDNGYVVRDFIRNEDDSIIPDNELVVERDERDTGLTHPFTAQKLLYQILELMGQIGSKHDEYKVRIIVHDQEDNIIDEYGKEHIVWEEE